VLRAVVLTQYWRVMDGQTDGIAVASTALAMQVLRRTVKTKLSQIIFYTALLKSHIVFSSYMHTTFIQH